MYFAAVLSDSKANPGKYNSQPGYGEDFGYLASKTGPLFKTDGLSRIKDELTLDPRTFAEFQEPLRTPRPRRRQKLLLLLEFDLRNIIHREQISNARSHQTTETTQSFNIQHKGKIVYKGTCNHQVGTG